jgi:hypothetical protein
MISFFLIFLMLLDVQKLWWAMEWTYRHMGLLKQNHMAGDIYYVNIV